MAPPLTEPGTCLFESRLSAEGQCRLFQNPSSVIEAWQPDDVARALAQLANAQNAGQYLAGFISYDAGYALEPRLRALMPDGKRALPLIRFYAYEQCWKLESPETDRLMREVPRGHRLSKPAPALSQEQYGSRAEQVLAYIRAGDNYQTNLTFPMRGEFKGPAISIYAALRTAQPVGYSAYLSFEEAEILSLSPELFVRRMGDRLETRPMKGTAARGQTAVEDELRRRALRADPKEQAENLMIVDLLRNDLSRVCRPGSVTVRRLFDVETYPTLHTMTSPVEGQIEGDRSVADIMPALFPCGSVTGAPKIRAQEIIRELEAEPREVYTGAIGFLEPGGDFSFNVAIRTLTAHRDGTYTYPVGGGIVADSTPAREYDECLLKARLVTDEAEPFDLIETISWSPEEGFVLLERHLTRLSVSALYFHRPFDREHVLAELDDAVKISAKGPLRLRLLLGPDGQLSVTTTALTHTLDPALRFGFAAERVDAADPYLRHKTTRRARFDRELARAAGLGAREVLFENQYGELTEGAWTNIFVKTGDRLLTPGLHAGLLPGTLRAELLASGRAHEARLTRQDLLIAEAVFLGNSVRGLMKAVFVGEDKDSTQPITAPASS